MHSSREPSPSPSTSPSALAITIEKIVSVCKSADKVQMRRQIERLAAQRIPSHCSPMLSDAKAQLYSAVNFQQQNALEDAINRAAHGLNLIKDEDSLASLETRAILLSEIGECLLRLKRDNEARVVLKSSMDAFVPLIRTLTPYCSEPKHFESLNRFSSQLATTYRRAARVANILACSLDLEDPSEKSVHFREAVFYFDRAALVMTQLDGANSLEAQSVDLERGDHLFSRGKYLEAHTCYVRAYERFLQRNPVPLAAPAEELDEAALIMIHQYNAKVFADAVKLPEYVTKENIKTFYQAVTNRSGELISEYLQFRANLFIAEGNKEAGMSYLRRAVVAATKLTPDETDFIQNMIHQAGSLAWYDESLLGDFRKVVKKIAETTEISLQSRLNVLSDAADEFEDTSQDILVACLQRVILPLMIEKYSIDSEAVARFNLECADTWLNLGQFKRAKRHIEEAMLRYPTSGGDYLQFCDEARYLEEVALDKKTEESYEIRKSIFTKIDRAQSRRQPSESERCRLLRKQIDLEIEFSDISSARKLADNLLSIDTELDTATQHAQCIHAENLATLADVANEGKQYERAVQYVQRFLEVSQALKQLSPFEFVQHATNLGTICYRYQCAKSNDTIRATALDLYVQAERVAREIGFISPMLQLERLEGLAVLVSEHQNLHFAQRIQKRLKKIHDEMRVESDEPEDSLDDEDTAS